MTHLSSWNPGKSPLMKKFGLNLVSSTRNLEPESSSSMLRVSTLRDLVKGTADLKGYVGSPSLGHHHVGITIRIEGTVIGTMLQRVQVSAGAQRVS